MKQIETYLWRVQWAGKTTTTRYQATESEIRARHPNAVRVEGSLVMREVMEPGDKAEFLTDAHMRKPRNAT